MVVDIKISTIAMMVETTEIISIEMTDREGITKIDMITIGTTSPTSTLSRSKFKKLRKQGSTSDLPSPPLLTQRQSQMDQTSTRQPYRALEEVERSTGQ